MGLSLYNKSKKNANSPEKILRICFKDPWFTRNTQVHSDTGALDKTTIKKMPRMQPMAHDFSNWETKQKTDD